MIEVLINFILNYPFWSIAFIIIIGCILYFKILNYFEKLINEKSTEIKKLKDKNIEISKAFNSSREEIQSLQKNYLILESSLKQKYEKNVANLKLTEKEIEKKNMELEVIKSLSEYNLNKTMKAFYEEYTNNILSDFQKFFKYKKNPSIKASNFIDEIKKEYSQVLKENKELKLQLSEYAPEIEDQATDAEPPKIKDYEIKDSECENWENFTYCEKLDFYLKKYKEKYKKKQKIGFEFERYCGYFLENKGYKVKYNGILNGLNDGGIDLIVEKDDKIIYVQCKYWSLTKFIRENSISQLFGSAFEFELKKGKSMLEIMGDIQDKKLIFLIMTKTKLSDEAKKFCELLKVKYKENIEIDYDNYPMVKLIDGEDKIFYLPTDFMYDKIIYNSTFKKYGRAMTCKEAEEKGYRHCYKWKGN